MNISAIKNYNPAFNGTIKFKAHKQNDFSEQVVMSTESMNIRSTGDRQTIINSGNHSYTFRMPFEDAVKLYEKAKYSDEIVELDSKISVSAHHY